MESILKEVGLIAKIHLAELGLNVAGLHYYTPRLAQTQRKGICISFDALTKDPEFFGQTFEIPRRRAPTKLVYKTLGAHVERVFSDREVLMDVYVHLNQLPSRLNTPQDKREVLDFSKMYEVTYEPLSTLIKRGEVEIDSTLAKYCKKYGLRHVMRQGPHFTSPDNSSVEALEAICTAQKIESVLEIGGGIGICGRAAQFNGIADFTFVDMNPVACQYLQQHFPRYRVVEANAFDFKFDRHWDVILIGIGYRQNPWFLERRGMDLADHCSVVVFQSGITAFYEFEHDWICGKPEIAKWPWWNVFQTLRPYFPSVWESTFDWQTCVFGAHEDVLVQTLKERLHQRGFSEIQYQHVTL